MIKTIDINNAVIESDRLSDDIMNCLNCLYSTVEGTCPMDREFGITIEAVDKPQQVAKNIYALDVVEKTEKYIPSVEVEEVTFEVDGERLIPHIKLKENEDNDSEEEEDEEEW